VTPALASPASQPRPKRYARFSEPPCGSDLSFPEAHVEARSCLKIARANGGIEAIERMREQIAITPLQKWELERMAWIGDLPLAVVARAIEYRAQVLAAFDELVNSERKKSRSTLGHCG
jgi:hypothetical protein